MKIRTRLTLWYAAILIVSLLVIGVETFHELAEQMEANNRKHFWEHALDETSEIIFSVGIPAILLGLAGGWWITRKTLAPVAALTEAVEKIHDRNLHEPLPRSGNGDELDRLTEVFNDMKGRLDGSFQRIREFTLHASHELKTPLTVMRGELEMALQEENSKLVSRELLLSQIDEIERLANIVDGLTLLAKADAGQIQLRIEPVALDDVVRESLADAKFLAQGQNIAVSLTQCDKATVNGDRRRLRQLLLNLTDNAVKYNIPNGTIDVALRVVERQVEITIENTGPGLALDLQGKVFDPFFRGDSSHNKAIEGCGLGLSICRWIVGAHGGSIRFVSQPDKVTTVTVRLPVC